jgi:hypothetical protein
MQHEFISATKEVQKELEDPCLKVVYDSNADEYQILKWKQTGCDQGYYSHQMSFKEWDRRAIIALRKGHWRRIDLKEFVHEMRKDREKVQKDSKKEVREAGQEFGKDVWNHVLHRRIYSHGR